MIEKVKGPQIMVSSRSVTYAFKVKRADKKVRQVFSFNYLSVFNKKLLKAAINLLQLIFSSQCAWFLIIIYFLQKTTRLNRIFDRTEQIMKELT